MQLSTFDSSDENNLNIFLILDYKSVQYKQENILCHILFMMNHAFIILHWNNLFLNFIPLRA